MMRLPGIETRTDWVLTAISAALELAGVIWFVRRKFRG